MKILWVEPGAEISTKDVSDGLLSALRAQGHDVGNYMLGKHLIAAQSYLVHQWKLAGKPEDHHPTREELLWLAGIEILPRALRYEADWVVIVAGANVHPDWFVLLRRAGVKTALILTESPYEDGPQAVIAREARVVFTNERASVAGLREVQPNTFYLPHSYDPAKHAPGGAVDWEIGRLVDGEAGRVGDQCTKPAPGAMGGPGLPMYQSTDNGPYRNSHDVVLVGTGWRERIEMLGKVNWEGIDLGLYGNWHLLGSRHHLRRYVRGGEMPNCQTVALYRKAKIGLNLYRNRMAAGHETVLPMESMNPRALELAACGVFSISDFRAEQAEVLGDAVPTFDTPAELERLVRHYLAHEDERRDLAARLPGYVAGRTFSARGMELVRILEGY